MPDQSRSAVLGSVTLGVALSWFPAAACTACGGAAYQSSGAESGSPAQGTSGSATRAGASGASGSTAGASADLPASGSSAASAAERASPEAGLDFGGDAAEAQASAPVDAWCAYPSLPGALPTSVVDFATQLEAAICARLVRCGDYVAADAAACTQRLDTENFVSSVMAMAAGGGGALTLALNATAAKACLDAFAQATCDKAATYCLTGQQQLEVEAPGVATYDAYNRDVGWNGLSCAGALQPIAGPGIPCAGGSSCQGGICAQSAPSPSPPDVCSPFAALGQSCTQGDMNCNCLPTTADGGICIAAPPVGQACTPDTVQTCGVFLYCAADGQCAVPSDLGAPCSALLFEPECKPGLYCGPSGTCDARLSANAPCTSPYACQDGLFCTGLVLMAPPRDKTAPPPLLGPLEVATLGTCSPPIPVGGACVPGHAALGADGCALFEASCDPMAQQCIADGPTGPPP